MLQANAPSFIIAPTGYVTPTACRQGQASGYSALPSGCMRDRVLARQVANTTDLIAPAAPGQAMAGPVGAAANTYLNGGAAGAAAQPSRSGATITTVPAPDQAGVAEIDTGSGNTALLIRPQNKDDSAG